MMTTEEWNDKPTGGDLIPRTDAELAVALAYQRAATEAKALGDGHDGAEMRDAILALAPAEPLAEVQALKAERDHWKHFYHAENEIGLKLLSRAEAAEAERDEWKRLYWLTRSFAVHDDDCTINRHPHYRDCSCGLRAALTTPEKGMTE